MTAKKKFFNEHLNSIIIPEEQTNTTVIQSKPEIVVSTTNETKPDVSQSQTKPEESKQNEVKENVIVQATTQPEIIEGGGEESEIQKYVSKKIKEAEEKSTLFYNKVSGFGKSKDKLKFSEIYAGVTVSLNRDIIDIIEFLEKNSTYTKTQILEMVLITGLKNINF